MNIFRLAADLLHLASILLLIMKLHASRSCYGISLRTQELYLIVFLTRYIDIFTRFISIYNTVMKIAFTSLTYYTIRLINESRANLHDHKRNDEKEIFLQKKYIVVVLSVLALATSVSFWPIDILWTLSFYIEAIAILPQLYLLVQERAVEHLTSHYIATLGAYRALYILNWLYRIVFDKLFRKSYVVIICGIVQTILYGDFFYYYYISVKEGQMMVLPS